MSRQHLEQIEQVVSLHQADPATDEVAASWLRCVAEHRVDAEDCTAPRILTQGELGESRAPLDDLIHTAQDGLDRLYGLVSDAGYTVLLCDADGVAVAYRGEEREAGEFRYWGVWLGGVWSEAVEGTNGIGTCIADERPITIHRGQHYRSRHTDLSCSGAPIFGPDGKLLAVLDVSAIDPTKSEQAHALTLPLTVSAARAIEEQFFRERFRREWIVATSSPEPGADFLLLAVDDSQRIIGANRGARNRLALDDAKLASGIGLGSIFGRDSAAFTRKVSADIPISLTEVGSGEMRPALVTPPEKLAGARFYPPLALHTRPRLDALAGLKPPEPSPVRGGMAPATLRRIEEYVGAHLADNIDLSELAALAGLSVFHFARQFKQSMGVTPHGYVMHRRLRRAREILMSSDKSLSEVAIATGFSDQSHLTRYFGQMFGMTPGQFRRSRR